MKKLLLVLSLVSAVVLTGCINPTSASSVGETAKSPATVRILTSSGATLALSNNPKYTTAAQGIITAIDAVTYGETVLTIEQVTKYVADICVQRGMTQQESIVFVSLARAVYSAYLQDHPQINLERITLSNPTVKIYITAFRDGLNDALEIIAATTPAA